MNKLFAITMIALRDAFRSRTFLVLMSMLLLLLIFLPFIIKGDGTPEGYLHILLYYTLSAARFLLALATIWLGCSAFAFDIESRRIQLIVTKPVRALQLWAGKWLALITLNALLLIITGITVMASIHFTMHSFHLPEAEQTRIKQDILTAQQQVFPEPLPAPIMNKKRKKMLATIIARNKDIDIQTLKATIDEAIIRESYIVPPGKERTWAFKLPEQLSDQTTKLQFTFSTSLLTHSPISGTWIISTPEKEKAYTLTTQSKPLLHHSFVIPSSPLSNQPLITVTYRNTNLVNATIVFEPGDGLQLLVRRHGLTTNLIRALLIMFSFLILLSALSLTTGLMFSLPVAAFFTTCMTLIVAVSRFIQTLAQQYSLRIMWKQLPENPSLWNMYSAVISKGLAIIIQPLQISDPLEMLTHGYLIYGETIVYCFLVRGVIYGGIMALCGIAILYRREMGAVT